MTDFTTLTNDDYGADKILTTTTVQALYDNGIWAGEQAQNATKATTTYNSGSGTWTKAGGTTGDTVLIELWAGGGSGATARGTIGNQRASGGEGGSYLMHAIRYEDFPVNCTYSVGAGGTAVTRSSDGSTNGNAGNDSTVTISGVTYTAKGGAGGAGSALGVDTSTTAQTSVKYGSYEANGVLPYTAGNGGAGASTGKDGGSALFAGAGGGGQYQNGTAGAGGTSIHGGAGGAATTGAGATATSGTAPSGGGGGITAGSGTIISGAGGAGRIVIRVMSGWRPSPSSRS